MTRLLSNHGVAGDISQILLHTNNINTLKTLLAVALKAGCGSREIISHFLSPPLPSTLLFLPQVSPRWLLN